MKINEEVINRNINAIKEFTEITRTQFRESEAKVESLQNMVLEQNSKIELMQQQISLLQQKLYSGGATA